MKDWIRWVLFFPAAVACYFATCFALAVFNLISGELSDIHVPRLVLGFIQSIVATYAYVWYGSRVAPHHKFVVALSLAALYLVANTIMFTLVFQVDGLEASATLYQVVCAIAAITSTIVACYQVRKDELEEIKSLEYWAKKEASQLADKLEANGPNPKNN